MARHQKPLRGCVPRWGCDPTTWNHAYFSLVDQFVVVVAHALMASEKPGIAPAQPAPPDMNKTKGRLPLDQLDPDAVKVVRRLVQAGHEAYLVGGCVRDVYLGVRPKDFDVATSATPEEIRRLFRNSRIIGRRFKLAHVYFGPKIIETSTFRCAPPPQSSDDDPLITRDNEWGSVEDDARRRDFTINGLFFDVDAQRIVDFVDGMDDLDGRLVRTIGKPQLRFREDPVRMIRAIKFAARLNFAFEDATWASLVEVAPDIVKSSQARLLEEIYKLMRGGAARNSFKLMLDSGLIQHLMPAYVDLYEDDAEAGLAGPAVAVAGGGSALLWGYLEALDDYHRETRQIASNGVLLAVLFAPLLGDRLDDTSRRELDVAIDQILTPVGSSLGMARRDRELARQILMAQQRMLSSGKRRRASLVQREYFHDALIFLGVAVKARGFDGTELERWRSLATTHRASLIPTDGRKRGRRGGRRTRKRTSRQRGGRPDTT